MKPTEGPYTLDGAEIRSKDGKESIALVNSHPAEHETNRRLLAKSWEMREALKMVNAMAEARMKPDSMDMWWALHKEIEPLLTSIDGDSQ